MLQTISSRNDRKRTLIPSPLSWFKQLSGSPMNRGMIICGTVLSSNVNIFYFKCLVVYLVQEITLIFYTGNYLLSFFVIRFAFSDYVSFIFYCSKIHTNQQIKEDTKSYKTYGKNSCVGRDTCGNCLLQFTMNCKLRFFKFCLADFLNTRNQYLLKKSSFSKYPQNYQNIFKPGLFSEYDVM